jgi:ATP-dependent DNA helicase RecG
VIVNETDIDGRVTRLKENSPVCVVPCTSYIVLEINAGECLSEREISGRLNEVYDSCLAFILRHVKRVQAGLGINSLGVLEVPKVVFKALLMNALIHRDYFVSAPIRIFVFTGRI